MKFGLICEGSTDQAAIENILCGIFEDEDLLESITQLQPGGASDSNQNGGWERVFEYLSNHKFRQSFKMIEKVVIQIDTDVAHLKNFDVLLKDEKGKKLKDVLIIVEKVKQKLIEKINSGEPSFYEKFKDRIIFAITVHSLEIWIYKLHCQASKDAVKIIDNAEYLLVREISKSNKFKKIVGKNSTIIKNYGNYSDLTMPFFDKKTRRNAINKLFSLDKSFQFFKQQLV